LVEEGVRGLGKGWAPTLVGYSMQGLGKFGFYELFKVVYGDLLGPVSGESLSSYFNR
jgi:solute carrier family 25 phosphate transporter 3